MKIDLSKLESLVDLMERSGLVELDFGEGDSRIGLELIPPAARRGGAAPAAPDDPNLIVTAPQVGVFRVMIAVGAQVKAGDMLGEIKVMDVKYGVTAPAAGVIKEILVEDNLGVEYGQPLIRIETGNAP